MNKLTPSNEFYGLVWRNPAESIPGNTVLEVPRGWNALIYLNGMAMDMKEEGSFEFSASDFPVLSGFTSLDGNSEIPVQVVFVRISLPNSKWGTQRPVMLPDDKGGVAEIRAFGTFTVNLKEPKSFVNNIVGMSNFDQEALNGLVRPGIQDSLTQAITQKVMEEKVPLMLLPVKTDAIGAVTGSGLNEKLAEYGLEITDFKVDAIVVPH